MRRAPLPALLVLACAPPLHDAPQAAIEIMYPENGLELQLEDDCSLDEPIVVRVDGVELVPSDPDNVAEGEGHWHGGFDLRVVGYCASSTTWCDDFASEGLVGGFTSLFAQLQDNGHTPLDTPDGEDQVEVFLKEPSQGCL